MASRKRYVVGFMFDHDLKRVLLIRKNRPEWQRNLLNGPGGLIEETDLCDKDAMRREFKEECGATASAGATDWVNFATLNVHRNPDGESVVVVFYCCTGYIRKAFSVTDERIVHCVIGYPDFTNSVPNMSWLIPMARNILLGVEHGTQHFVIVEDAGFTKPGDYKWPQ